MDRETKTRLKAPTDPYSPDWAAYIAQNPGVPRTLSAAAADGGAGGTGEGGGNGEGGGADFDLSQIPEEFVTDGKPDLAAFRTSYDTIKSAQADAPDLSFIPDTFVTDGKPDLAKFQASYEDAVAFKAQSDEAQAALPKEAKDYVWAVPEGFELPEGFEPGEDFDLAKMANPEDPDLPQLREIMNEHGGSQELLNDLSGLLVGREIRGLMDMNEKAGAEKTALGPDGAARMKAVTRSVTAKLPETQAKALMDGVTSADGLRAVEALLRKSGGISTGDPGGGLDHETASIDDRILHGLRQRGT